MTRFVILAGLFCCLLWAQGTPAACAAPVPHIELWLLVLDDEIPNWTEHHEMKGTVISQEITFLPPEHGAFVAIQMDCGPAEPGPCRPSWPTAVLNTFEGLKRFIGRLPRGASVEWNPSCMGPWPREHPLSANGASEEIERFATAHHVKFVIHKAG